MPFRMPVPIICLLLASLMLAACNPIVASRGNIVDDERLARVKVGASQDQVFQALGSPTVVSTFDDELWYYVGHRTEQTAFFAPDVVQRRVVAIRFDNRFRVAEITELDPEQGIAVNPVDRTTPTAGRSLGFLEQIFGNFGRF